MLGGLAYPISDIDEICFEAHTRKLKVHMDGARVFNAAEATATPVARIARNVDSIMFCLSKGLGAPVGSILAGTNADMARARLYRKRLGGGLRQAGVLAAAGLIALQDHAHGLGPDRHNARIFADLIAGIPGISIDSAAVQTNIAIFDITGTGSSPETISASLRSHGVLLNGINEQEMRAVTHYDVSEDDCRHAAAVLRTVLS